MPLTTAALDRRTAQRIAAAAIAAAAQGLFCLFILHEKVEPTALTNSKPLEASILQTVRRLRPAAPQREGGRRISRHPPAQKSEVPLPAEVIGSIPLPRAVTSMPHAPIDWQGALRSEVRAQESRSRAGIPRFGLPQPRAREPPAPEFGWDYAHTHRLRQLSGGGLLINVSDRCAVVIYAFLLVGGCNIGRIPVNGRLFDHMHDRRVGVQGALP